MIMIIIHSLFFFGTCVRLSQFLLHALMQCCDMLWLIQLDADEPEALKKMRLEREEREKREQEAKDAAAALWHPEELSVQYPPRGDSGRSTHHTCTAPSVGGNSDGSSHEGR